MAKSNNTCNHQNEFKFDLMIASPDGMGVQKIGEHTNYNLDGKVPASTWVRGTLPKTYKTFATTDGISIMDSSDSRCRGTTCNGSLGYMACNSNIVEKNAQMVALFSLPFSCAHGFNLLPENIDRAMALYAARRLVVDNVWNDKDSYMVPDTANEKYAEFNSDAYIIAIVDHQSYQTSIKGTHNGVDYEFLNQFYPFSKAETYELLGIEKKTNFKDDSRWCLENGKFADLSPEASRVLDAFRECIRKSASARPAYCKEHPELQATRWDAGYRQLKGLFAEAAPDAFTELKAATKALKEKMLPLVYELGFLRK